MVTFDAVVQDFHVCLTEHLVVEFLGDDVWEHLLAIPMDTSSLTSREFSQSGFSGCIPISCPPNLIKTDQFNQLENKTTKCLPHVLMNEPLLIRFH